MIVRHVESSLDRQPPFPAEVPLEPCLRLRRDERHEIITFAYLLADLLIPLLSAAQLAFVVPDLEAEGRERIPERPGRLAIRRGVAQKNREWAVGIQCFYVVHCLYVRKCRRKCTVNTRKCLNSILRTIFVQRANEGFSP